MLMLTIMFFTSIYIQILSATICWRKVFVIVKYFIGIYMWFQSNCNIFSCTIHNITVCGVNRIIVGARPLYKPRMPSIFNIFTTQSIGPEYVDLRIVFPLSCWCVFFFIFISLVFTTSTGAV